MTDCACSLERASYVPAADADAERANWPAVASLAFGVFGLVTAEFLPVSILTPMALDLGVSDGAAGQAVTATAVVAAIAGPAVVIGTGRMDRRHVVWALSALLVVSNLVAALATDVAMLLVARMTLRVALGGFWSLAAALALRLVPAPLLPRAMAVIFTGVSIATVCAAPLGAYLSSLWGWRLTFAAAAACGALALVSQLLSMPKLMPTAAPGLHSFLAVLRRPTVSLGLLTVLLVVSAHFAGFTYLRPFLERVSKLDVAGLSLALLAFGIGGFFGNIAGGALAERSGSLAVGAASLLIAISAAALFVAGASSALAYAATAGWGFTEVTIAALVGHSIGTMTSKYIHTLDTALIMAADTISGYIQGLLEGTEFRQTAYAIDRESRKAALARFLQKAAGDVNDGETRLAV